MAQESWFLMQRDGGGTRVHKLKLDPDPASPRRIDRRISSKLTAYNSTAERGRSFRNLGEGSGGDCPKGSNSRDYQNLRTGTDSKGWEKRQRDTRHGSHVDATRAMSCVAALCAGTTLGHK